MCQAASSRDSGIQTSRGLEWGLRISSSQPNAILLIQALLRILPTVVPPTKSSSVFLQMQLQTPPEQRLLSEVTHVVE